VLSIPLWVFRLVAPALERAGGLARGGLRAAVDHLGDDLTGDPAPSRALLGRDPLIWADCVRAALAPAGVGVLTSASTE